VTAPVRRLLSSRRRPMETAYLSVGRPARFAPRGFVYVKRHGRFVLVRSSTK
jgi:hypothetical protein